jgi:hypothetical protein
VYELRIAPQSGCSIPSTGTRDRRSARPRSAEAPPSEIDIDDLGVVCWMGVLDR